MTLTIHSPHSGHPVKIREEDIGRAVRDEQNRIFYVVPRAHGEGHYGAITRKGSPKDEERYDRLAAHPVQEAQARTAAASAVAHDATGGRKRRRPLRRAVFTLIALGALALAGAYALDYAELLPESIDQYLPELPLERADDSPRTPAAPAVPTPSD
ncbi:MAG: hypothetical protein V3V20_02130 [Algisphaera sp.]